MDVAFDLVGGDYGPRTIEMPGPGGLLVTIDRTNAAVAARAKSSGRRFAGIAVEPDRVGLEGLAELVDEGKLRVHVDRVLPLEERRSLMPCSRGVGGPERS